MQYSPVCGNTDLVYQSQSHLWRDTHNLVHQQRITTLATVNLNQLNHTGMQYNAPPPPVVGTL